MINFNEKDPGFENILYEILDSDYESLSVLKDGSIFDGWASISLLYYSAYTYTNKYEYYEKALFYFEKAFNNPILNNFSLSRGSTGVMWLMNFYAKRQAFEVDFDIILDAYDNTISRIIDGYEDNIDPMHGMLSIANYLFSRQPKQANKILEKIFFNLYNSKIVMSNGFAWHTAKDDELLGTFQHINFGYAHGVVSILYFVSKFKTLGIEVDKCNLLLSEGLKYFFSYKEESPVNTFPIKIQKGEVFRNERLAFCYGDLGIACGLTAIGKNLTNNQLLLQAKEVALNIAKASISNSMRPDDIGLCHGAAGNGYMFSKLFNFYGSAVLKDAAHLQYQSLLDLKRDDGGIAGLSALDYDRDKGVLYRKSDAGFINGTAGVGLSIIAMFESDYNQSWDQLLNLT